VFCRYPHIKIESGARCLVPVCKRRKKLLPQFDSGVGVDQDAIEEESACLLVNSDRPRLCGVEELETGAKSWTSKQPSINGTLAAQIHGAIAFNFNQGSATGKIEVINLVRRASVSTA